MLIPFGSRFKQRRDNPLPCGPQGTCWVCLHDFTHVGEIVFDVHAHLAFCSEECLAEYRKHFRGKYQAYRANII